MQYYTKTSDLIDLFNIVKGWWEVITLWTRPSENNTRGNTLLPSRARSNSGPRRD